MTLSSSGNSTGDAAALFIDLPFETGILGLKAGRLGEPRCPDGPPAAVNRAVAAAVGYAVDQGYQFLSCRVADGRPWVAEALESAGFRLVECLLTLERPVAAVAGEPQSGIRLATPSDAEAVGRVAEACFVDDRYHADPRIDDRAADRLKRLWAENDCRQRGDVVFVAVDDSGRVVGFHACLAPADAAVIDLIGVLPEAQGRGVGRRLVAAALNHYAGRRPVLRTGTQARNTGSLALYAAMGFRIVRSEFTFHWHSHP
ncbi:MAG: GNAT family N-acetyltransferase [Pseudomonadota bacterium]